MADIQSTCSVEYCDNGIKVASAGLCNTHYIRVRKTGTPHRTCKTCGAEVYGDPKGRYVYCGDACAQCSVDGCTERFRTNGMCNLHNWRVRKFGTPYKECETCGQDMPPDYGKAIYCSDDCRPRCKVSGCDSPYYSTDGFCARHKALDRAHGTPVGKHEWVEKSDEYTCIVCGTKFGPNGRSRQFCHPNCQGLYRVYGESVPSLDFTCAVCDVLIRWEPGPEAWRRRDKKICDRCRNAGSTRHGISPGILAKKHGVNCGICGLEVNMEARWPAPDSASVDHIVPVSLGGGHDLENLQLSHWACNHKKRDNANYVHS